MASAILTGLVVRRRHDHCAFRVDATFPVTFELGSTWREDCIVTATSNATALVTLRVATANGECLPNHTIEIPIVDSTLSARTDKNGTVVLL